jgi:uncharacterized protein YecE (DUF72 family)
LLRIGPAGWAYKDWAGIVYPSSKPKGFSAPEYLARYFDAIEINTSFYGPPRAETCRQWLEQVAHNERFLFTAKLSQRFTHGAGATADDERQVREGFDVLRDAERLSAVLLQFPYSFHRTAENAAYLEKLLTRFADYPLEVEVRHVTWNEPGFYAMLRERGVGFCNVDQPLIGRSLKPSEKSTAAVGYVRLHGRRYDTWFSDDPAVPSFERYNYLYPEAELKPWVERIRAVTAESPTTFVITNHHYQGKAVVNALQLVHLLTGAKVKAPEPLVERYPELAAINT